MSALMKSLSNIVYYNIKNINVYNSQICMYSRWVHRRPQRVLNPKEFEKSEKPNCETKVHEYEEGIADLSTDNLNKNYRKPINFATTKLIDIQELEEKTNYVDYNIKSIPRKEGNARKSIFKKKIETTDMLETVIDAEGSFVYTKLKNNDPLIGQLMVVVKSKNQLVKKELALLEGKRLIRDALTSGCKLQTLLYSRKSDIEYLKDVLPKLGAKLYKMPYRDIQMWSTLTTSPGLMGIFKTPEVEKFVSSDDSLPLTIICDNVREPGNLGAILRTAAAVGCQKVILTKGCADLWDTKVLRSACGAHFHMKIIRKQDFHTITEELEDEFQLFIADNKIITSTEEIGDACADESQTLEGVLDNIPMLPYYSVNFKTSKSVVLVIGGETNGISEESYKIALNSRGVRLNIPMNNSIESLNAGTALGIIVFEIKRQLSVL